MTYLNAISSLGLVAMVLLAWLVSSHRDRFPWRLVLLGTFLQLILAAIFFNSQQWTFSRTFHSPDEYLEVASRTRAFARNLQLPDPASEGARVSLADLAETFPDSFEAPEIRAIVDRHFEEHGGRITVDRFANGIVFAGVQGFFDLIEKSVTAGKEFLFLGHGADDPRALLVTFAFGVLPTIVFFSALMSVLYYIGLMKLVVRGMAWVMQKTLRTTAAESLAAAANVFVGQTEAPLVIRPYIASMTRSELNALMVGGFATISGSLMALFATTGISAGHLLTASIISAPAALLIAKVMLPETETPKSPDSIHRGPDPDQPANVIEAAAIGARDGMMLAINVAAMLIAFLALIAFVDILLGGIGSLIQVELSLKRIFGWVFYPFAWIMGIHHQECLFAGELLGTKTVLNEFVAYTDLTAACEQAAAGTGPAVSERTKVIMTYALCGFSNFSSIGIQIGGIGGLAPSRRSDLAVLGLRAMFGGMLACCMTACIAGMWFGILGGY